MVERDLAKVDTGVRFPSPAPILLKRPRKGLLFSMNYPTITLKKGEGRTLNQGGAWVYDNELLTFDENLEAGSLVCVLAFNGYGLGVGFYNPHSKIRIRLLSRDVNATIDQAFIQKRVQDAFTYRKELMDIHACRLIFGEADFLPGLVVDKFNNVLVVQSLALGMEVYKLWIVDELKRLCALENQPILGVYERSDVKVRDLEGLPRVKGFIGEEFDTNVEIIENGVKYTVDVKDGQKTGFFLDQKYNRKAIQSLVKGKRVLDCFTHTGSFALNAGLAGAQEVIGVDASDLAIHQAMDNAKLNHLEKSVHFQVADVFDLLPELATRNERFDVIVLDPPAFTKSRASIKNAMKGYKEINLRALKLIEEGGYLATCSCSHFMTLDLFKECIHQAARDAHKRLRQIEVRTQAPDHPILWDADESDYLKFIIFQVVSDK